MKLFIDFETRSRIDLKKCGVYVYAEDVSTDILCCAFKADKGDTHVWRRGTSPELLHALVDAATEIHAHNAQFERVLWNTVCVPRMQWPEVPLEKWRCTAAKAATHALPRGLGDACTVMGVSQQKDMDGYKVMMKFCKPMKDGSWYWDDKAYDKLCAYCAQDVEAEYALDAVLADITPSELEVWRKDQIINDRGVYVDRHSIEAMLEAIDAEETRLLKQWRQLTNYQVNSPKQVEVTLAYFKSEFGVELEDLTKGTVGAALEGVES